MYLVNIYVHAKTTQKLLACMTKIGEDIFFFCLHLEVGLIYKPFFAYYVKLVDTKNWPLNKG